MVFYVASTTKMHQCLENLRKVDWTPKLDRSSMQAVVSVVFPGEEQQNIRSLGRGVDSEIQGEDPGQEKDAGGQQQQQAYANYAEYPHRPPTPPSPSDRSNSPPPQHREPGKIIFFFLAFVTTFW